jgi:hypothetical protein
VWALTDQDEIVEHEKELKECTKTDVKKKHERVEDHLKKKHPMQQSDDLIKEKGKLIS